MIVSRGCILYRLFVTPRIRWHLDLYCSHTVFIASVDNVRRIQRHPNNNIIRRAILSDEPCHQAIVAPSTTVSCVGADWGKIYEGGGASWSLLLYLSSRWQEYFSSRLCHSLESFCHRSTGIWGRRFSSIFSPFPLFIPFMSPSLPFSLSRCLDFQLYVMSPADLKAAWWYIIGTLFSPRPFLLLFSRPSPISQ